MSYKRGKDYSHGNPERVRFALRPPHPTATPLASLGLAKPSSDGARRATRAREARGGRGGLSVPKPP